MKISLALRQAVPDSLRAILQLMKARLSLTVAFSSVASYWIFCRGEPDVWNTLGLTIGGFLIAGSANAMNQWMERELDAQMERTAHRPLVTGILTPADALRVVAFTGILGWTLLALLHWKVAIAGTIGWLFYILGYTYLKRRSPIAMELGALAGALPVLGGWMACSGKTSFSLAGSLFLAQWLWQYPHTWGFLLRFRQDFQKTGVRLLAPSRTWFPFLSLCILAIFWILIAWISIQLSLKSAWIWILGTGTGFLGIGAWWWLQALYRKCPEEWLASRFILLNLLALPLAYVLLIGLLWWGSSFSGS